MDSESSEPVIRLRGCTSGSESARVTETDLTSRVFRLWLLGQTDRQDSVGQIARIVLASPCCIGDQYALPAHMSEAHSRSATIALLAALAEWRGLGHDDNA